MMSSSLYDRDLRTLLLPLFLPFFFSLLRDLHTDMAIFSFSPFIVHFPFPRAYKASFLLFFLLHHFNLGRWDFELFSLLL